MRLAKFGGKRIPSWLVFVGAKFGFSCAGMLGKAWVARMVKIESRGFGILSELKCAECHKNEVAKIWVQESIHLGWFLWEPSLDFHVPAWHGMGAKNHEISTSRFSGSIWTKAPQME